MRIALTVAQGKDLAALLAMTQRAGTPALSVAARRFEEGIAKRKKPSMPLPEQLALWEGDAPWRGRLGPDVPVRCDRFVCTLPLRCCLQRQDAQWPGKKAGIHEYCASGECAQGREYRLRSAYSASADWASKSKQGRGSYQFFRRDAGVQRQKRRAFIREEYQAPTIDRPPGSRDAPEPIDREDDDVKQIIGDTMEKG